MRSRYAVLLAWIAFLGFAFSATTRAADFNVPSVAYPTLQDAVSAAAVSIAVASTGAIVSNQTRVLLTQEQLGQALERAGTAAQAFQTPGQQP